MEDKEITAKFKCCKTVEELKVVGKEIGYELTDEEAKDYFEKFSKSGELSDDELDNVSGGCAKWRNGRAYSGEPPHRLIITMLNSCRLWKDDRENHGKRNTCSTCWYRGHFEETRHCFKRTYENDELNPK